MPNYNKQQSPSTRTNCKPGESNLFFLKYDTTITENYARQQQNADKSQSLGHVQFQFSESGRKEKKQ